MDADTDSPYVVEEYSTEYSYLSTCSFILLGLGAISITASTALITDHGNRDYL